MAEPVRQGDAIRRWRELLAAWAIPERITAAVVDSPWTPPTAVFARRADASRPGGESWRRAVRALPGTLLDVGSGAGAASLPLARHVTHLTAVDASAAMLSALDDRAARVSVPTRTIVGRWPDIADEVPPSDVVVCHHVFYNAPDLDRFAAALSEHARRRVVVELSPAHPMRPLNPLWSRLHGLTRPDGPTWMDAIQVLRELGLDPGATLWPRPPREAYASFADLIATTRRRLCLPADRDDELASALIDLGVDPARPQDLGTESELVTIWWDVG
jgi:SAM-dependent methyltransferase